MVRLATADDAADVARLMIGFRDWQGRSEPANDVIAATVRRLLADPNTEFLLGGSPPTGVCQLRYRLRSGPEPTTAASRICSSRRTGAARGSAASSWRQPYERARERGCARIGLDANEANAPALALYRSVGFDSWSSAAGGNDLFMRLRL